MVSLNQGIRWLTSEHIGFFKEILNIFSLRNEDTLIRSGNLTPKKVSQFSEVFSLKFLSQIAFQIRSSVGVISSYNYVINIHIEYNNLIIGMFDEYSAICITLLILESCSSLAGSIKSGSGRLF